MHEATSLLEAMLSSGGDVDTGALGIAERLEVVAEIEMRFFAASIRRSGVVPPQRHQDHGASMTTPLK